ncbi:Ribonuclease T2 [Schistosoma japonicum]|uniref:Ribonuclease S-4 n=1 Tax=Schistosoma japonicum TaxID=6182 RepID=C1LGE0_SCHJA|nr:Ribonuclease T2 [Schistosoma japonicum]CAX73768.1 Ribonuclease S-4 precursor [Schistosoma japonicum]
MQRISLCFIMFALIGILHGRYNKKSLNWDYLQLKLAWPPSYCSEYPCKLPPKLSRFTIRGFWPTVWPYRPQTNCSYHGEFDILSLMAIRTEMDYAWPNLTDYKNSKLMCKLKSYGIIPQSTALIGKAQIMYILQSAYGMPVALKCRPFKQARPKYEYIQNGDKFKLAAINRDYQEKLFYQLDEVIFCFNVNLTIISCPFSEQQLTNKCPDVFIFNDYSKRTQ